VLSNNLVCLFRQFLCRRSRGLYIHVVGHQILHVERWHTNDFLVLGVFDATVGAEYAAPHREIVTFRDRPEIIQLDLLRFDRCFDGDVRFGKKVRIPVENNFAVFKHRTFDKHLGRVFAFLRSDVANVVGREINVSEFERPVLALIYVGKLTAGDDEFIDLERVDRLYGILPAPLLDRCFVF
jgi:hypothetical protein